jgi:hypothetical protein
MNVTRDEAAEALDAIEAQGDKVFRLKGYHHGAPFFIIWGFVWLIANSVTQFWSDQAGMAWMVMLAIGIASSTILGLVMGAKVRGTTGKQDPFGRRMGFTTVVVFLFIFALMSIAQPETSRQVNAMISIFFPFMYMAGGIWAGWRLFAIGVVTAAAVLVGYFYIQDYYDLWMGVFGGGSLIAGGIWLRSA